MREKVVLYYNRLFTLWSVVVKEQNKKGMYMKLQLLGAMCMSLLSYGVILSSQTNIVLSQKEYNNLFTQLEKQRDHFTSQIRQKDREIANLQQDLLKARHRGDTLQKTVKKLRDENESLQGPLSGLFSEVRPDLASPVLDLEDDAADEILPKGEDLKAAYLKLKQQSKSQQVELDSCIQNWKLSQELNVRLRGENEQLQRNNERLHVKYGLCLAGEIDYQNRINQLEAQVALRP